MNKFFWSVVLAWLGLFFAKFLGFDFGVDMKLLSQIVFLFFSVALTCLVVKNWSGIKSFLRKAWLTFKKPIIDELSQYNKPFEKNFYLPFILIRHLYKTLKGFFFNEFFLFLFLITGVLFDFFFLTSSSDVIVFVVILSWIGVMRVRKTKSRVSVFYALIFLAICPFLIMTGKKGIAEKSAVWAFVFLVVGLVKMIFETRRELKTG